MTTPTEVKYTSLSLSSLITCFISCLVLVSCLLDDLSRTSSTANASTLPLGGEGLSWDHSVDLNEDFRILWKIINQDITFEIQARTMGYVGFGFSPDGNIAGSDMAIGWVDRGHTYFQVSFHLHFCHFFPGELCSFPNSSVSPLLNHSMNHWFGHVLTCCRYLHWNAGMWIRMASNAFIW